MFPWLGCLLFLQADIPACPIAQKTPLTSRGTPSSLARRPGRWPPGHRRCGVARSRSAAPRSSPPRRSGCPGSRGRQGAGAQSVTTSIDIIDGIIIWTQASRGGGDRGNPHHSAHTDRPETTGYIPARRSPAVPIARRVSLRWACRWSSPGSPEHSRHTGHKV